MNSSWQSRTQMLVGDEVLQSIATKHVLIAGLGGVGGMCAEMIARAGIGQMTIVDADVVDRSNCNRQLVALHSTIGQQKTEVLAARLRDINPDIQLNILTQFIDAGNIDELLQSGPFDYGVDCIDTLQCKVAFIKACIDHKLPVVSAMGAGGKFDPTQVQVADIEKSYQCRLAKYVRKHLHAAGVRGGVTVVFSPEIVGDDKIVVVAGQQNKKSMVGTISYMPAIFGCMAASVVLREITGC